ncbi:hypothetical protein D3C75_1285100 [compost metagenome]
MTEVTGTYQGHIDLLIQLQNMTDLFDEIRHVISNAFSAEITKIGQILTNLRRIKVQLLPEFLRRNG